MMAYFGSNYYEAEPGVYLPIPYSDTYDDYDSVSRHHAFLSSYSCYESHVDPYYDPALTRSVISYSVSSVSPSKLVVYDPFHTQIRISLNKLEFNEPDFEEYDPTPYGGGYDIAQTYGKPLPPSDEICYPQHAPRAIASSPGREKEGDHAAAPAIAPSLDPSPGREKEEDHAPAPEIAPSLDPSPGREKEEDHAPVPQKGSQPTDEETVEEEHLGSRQSGEIEGNFNFYDDHYPWTGYEYEYGNGRIGSHECEKQVPQAPWGYNPEAMELCESIFGHWPCLYRQKKYGHEGTRNEDRNSTEWRGTADFLFGTSSYPYTLQNDAKHYLQEQPYYLQFQNEENENPWLHKFNLF